MRDRVTPATSEYAGRAQEPDQQEPTDKERMAELRRQVDALTRENQSKKKGIRNSEILEFISQYIPDITDIPDWPEEAKIIIYHLNGILKGIVIGTHINGEQIATYIKDLKDETS